MSRRLASVYLAVPFVAALWLGTVAAAHAASGYLGISVAVDGEGFFMNPTLKSARVAKVAPQSPAQRAGITEGDLILEVEGRKVQGAKASELKPYLDQAEGQTVQFLLKKPSGEERQVTVTAGPKP